MYVSETFLSIQGEGLWAGTPSFFIRTSGCNLRCRWCDTPYTSWLPEGTRRPVDELVDEAAASPARHVVVTGGEPLLQREIGALTGALHEAGLVVTVETAGTVDPDFNCDLLSVSPKTSNSDPQGNWRSRHQSKREDLGSLRRLVRRFPEHQLKFVVQDGDDVPEILELLQLLGGGLSRERVVLMPEGRSVQELATRNAEIAALCIEHGFRYTPRLQFDLFGGGRGV